MTLMRTKGTVGKKKNKSNRKVARKKYEKKAGVMKEKAMLCETRTCEFRDMAPKMKKKMGGTGLYMHVKKKFKTR